MNALKRWHVRSWTSEHSNEVSKPPRVYSEASEMGREDHEGGWDREKGVYDHAFDDVWGEVSR